VVFCVLLPCREENLPTFAVLPRRNRVGEGFEMVELVVGFCLIGMMMISFPFVTYM
jgi:hypothetical protein